MQSLRIYRLPDQNLVPRTLIEPKFKGSALRKNTPTILISAIKDWILVVDKVICVQFQAEKELVQVSVMGLVSGAS